MGFGIERYDCVRTACFTRMHLRTHRLLYTHHLCIIFSNALHTCIFVSFFSKYFRFLKAAVEARYRVRTMIRGEGWQYRLGSSLHNLTETENARVGTLHSVIFFISHNILSENCGRNDSRRGDHGGRFFAAKENHQEKKSHDLSKARISFFRSWSQPQPAHGFKQVGTIVR